MENTPDSERRYRPVVAGMTALLVLGLLTAALWPAGGPPRSADPSESVAPPAVPLPPVHAVSPAPAQPASETAPSNPPPAAEPLPDLPASDPSRLVAYGDRTCPQIALTFDAGSGADGAAAILDVLKKHGITSTFFLTGKWVERYTDVAKRIAADGHEIANHTYSHPDLTKIAPDDVLLEIQKGEEAIRQVTGKESRPLFREPFGAFSEEQRRLVRQAGYSYSIYWDVDTLDWQFPPVDTLVKRITEKSRNGSIVLMHMNVPDTAIAVDQAVPMLREKGYGLVTVSRVLRCP